MINPVESMVAGVIVGAILWIPVTWYLVSWLRDRKWRDIVHAQTVRHGFRMGVCDSKGQLTK